MIAVSWCVYGYGGIFHNDRCIKNLFRGHSDSLQATLVKTVKDHVWSAKVSMVQTVGTARCASTGLRSVGCNIQRYYHKTTGHVASYDELNGSRQTGSPMGSLLVRLNLLCRVHNVQSGLREVKQGLKRCETERSLSRIGDV